MGFGGLLAMAVGLVGIGASGAQAQNAASYSFAGLAWGSSSKEVAQAMRGKGFRVVGWQNGRRQEFGVNQFHAVMKVEDRGKRMIAVGSMGGQRVTVDLVFGNNDKLGHVIVKSAYWDGTVRGARRMIKMARTIVQMYEELYGPAQKIQDDGWPDTAIWKPARDGSQMSLYVRGMKGFMFSPSYKTALRIHMAHPTYNDKSTSGWMPVNVLKPTVKLPETAARPTLTEKQRKEQLRRMYQKQGTR
jgi:hypothetical protein